MKLISEKEIEIAAKESIMNDSLEIWRKISGYEDRYEISSNGNVRRIDYTLYKADGTTQHYKQKDLIPYVSSNGYMAVSLCRYGRTVMKLIHSILADTFILNGYTNMGLVVNHKDGNKQNNDLLNLEVVTSSANNYHAIKTGLRTTPSGSSHPKAILTESDVLEIKKQLASSDMDRHTSTNLAKQYGVAYNTISSIRFGVSWRKVNLPETQPTTTQQLLKQFIKSKQDEAQGTAI